MSCDNTAWLAVIATEGQTQVDLPEIPVPGAPVYVVVNGSRMADDQDFSMLEHRVLFEDGLTDGDQVTVRWLAP